MFTFQMCFSRTLTEKLPGNADKNAVFAERRPSNRRFYCRGSHSHSHTKHNSILHMRVANRDVCSWEESAFCSFVSVWSVSRVKGFSRRCYIVVCATLRTQKATQTNFRIGHTLWCSYHSVFDRRGNITGVWCWRIVGFAIVDVISRHLIRRRYISRLVESLCTVFSYKET